MTIQGKKVTIYPNEFKDVVSKGILILNKGHNELKDKVNKNIFDPIKDALRAIIVRGIKQTKLVNPTEANFDEVSKSAKELFGNSFYKTITSYTTKYDIKLDDWLKGIDSVLNDLIAKPLLLDKKTETKAIDNKSAETKDVDNKTDSKISYDVNNPKHKYLTDFEKKFTDVDKKLTEFEYAKNLYKTNKSEFYKLRKEMVDYAKTNNISLTGMNKVQDPIIQKAYNLYSEVMNLT